MSKMLDYIKATLKIDGVEDDLVLSTLVDGAKESLKAAGIPIPNKSEEGAAYKSAVAVWVLLIYENYGNELNVKSLESSLQTMILQLRPYGGDENESS